MATWWMTQAVPLTATALLPFLALPIFNVMPVKEAASQYYSPILFLILGGAFLALAIERVGLHKRLALAIIGMARMGRALCFHDRDGNPVDADFQHQFNVDHGANSSGCSGCWRR